jgi:hypothetical protein
MSKQAFETKKDTIEAILNENVKYPNIPVDAALQEAEDLLVWCRQDKELLVKAGLEWTLVEDLSIRIGACRYIQSEWQKEYRSIEDAQREWGEKSPAALNSGMNCCTILNMHFTTVQIYLPVLKRFPKVVPMLI